MRYALGVLILFVGCSGSNVPPAADVPASSVAAPVTIVDLEGKPLQDMIPIAATRPNAFEEPVASGPPTDEHGHSEFSIPSDQPVFVRGWDPDVKFFANNFYEIEPGPAAQTEAMTLVMVPGASLAATIVSADGTVKEGVPVEIMMAHPSMGPWWPDRGVTGPGGAVHFSSLPAGQYVVRVVAEDGSSAVLDEVALAPGGHVDLGRVVLTQGKESVF